MIFSELYSAYYHTLAKILTRAVQGNITEQELQRLVMENAFSESVLTILPALQSGKWPLLRKDLSSVLHHPPTMPLTILQKRWLKAVVNDPRIRLFHLELPDLAEVEPLFTEKDYKIYDQYADGDPFEDDTYIAHFHLIRQAIRTKSPVSITMLNRRGKIIPMRFYPKGFEYSIKDDKIRIVASGCKFRYFNLARVKTCFYYHGSGPWRETPKEEKICEICMEITDERNALERVMLHFAHFQKQAEQIGRCRYRLRVWYWESDETEMVIRVLSFGRYVKVIQPESFVKLIQQRLISQKSCELDSGNSIKK